MCEIARLPVGSAVIGRLDAGWTEVSPKVRQFFVLVGTKFAYGEVRPGGLVWP